MTLGELIKLLETEEDRILPIGFDHPHSYRGYYDQLAFEPVENITVKKMLEAARSAVGKTFHGYKGGVYPMNEWTTVYIAPYGVCGEEIGYLSMAFILNDLDIWRKHNDQ